MLEYRRWQPIRAEGELPRMSLLIVYVVLMIAGDLVAYLIGLVIREAPAASLPAFLAMYFLFLWVAWVIAVRITQPRAQLQ